MTWVPLNAPCCAQACTEIAGGHFKDGHIPWRLEQTPPKYKVCLMVKSEPQAQDLRKLGRHMKAMGRHRKPSRTLSAYQQKV